MSDQGVDPIIEDREITVEGNAKDSTVEENKDVDSSNSEMPVEPTSNAEDLVENVKKDEVEENKGSISSKEENSIEPSSEDEISSLMKDMEDELEKDLTFDSLEDDGENMEDSHDSNILGSEPSTPQEQEFDVDKLVNDLESQVEAEVESIENVSAEQENSKPELKDIEDMKKDFELKIIQAKEDVIREEKAKYEESIEAERSSLRKKFEEEKKVLEENMEMEKNKVREEEKKEREKVTEEFEKRIAELNTKLVEVANTADDVKSKLQGQIEELKNNHEEEKTRIRADLEKKCEEEKQVQMYVDEMEKKLSENKSLSENVNEELEKKDLEISDLKKKLEEILRVHDESERKSKEEFDKMIEEEKVNKKKMKDDLDARILDLETQKTDLMNKVGESGKEEIVGSVEISELKSRLSEMSKLYDEGKMRNEESQKLIEEEKINSQKVKDYLDARILDLETQKTDHMNKDGESTEISELQSKLSEMSKLYEEEKRRYEEESQKMMEEEKVKSKKVRDELEARIGELSAGITNLQSQITESERIAGKEEEEVKEMRSKLSEMTKLYEEEKRRYEEESRKMIEEEKAKEKAFVADLEERGRKHEAELDEWKKKCGGMESEREGQCTELEKLKAEKEELVRNYIHKDNMRKVLIKMKEKTVESGKNLKRVFEERLGKLKVKQKLKIDEMEEIRREMEEVKEENERLSLHNEQLQALATTLDEKASKLKGGRRIKSMPHNAKFSYSPLSIKRKRKRKKRKVSGDCSTPDSVVGKKKSVKVKKKKSFGRSSSPYVSMIGRTRGRMVKKKKGSSKMEKYVGRLYYQAMEKKIEKLRGEEPVMDKSGMFLVSKTPHSYLKQKHLSTFEGNYDLDENKVLETEKRPFDLLSTNRKFSSPAFSQSEKMKQERAQTSPYLGPGAYNYSSSSFEIPSEDEENEEIVRGVRGLTKERKGFGSTTKRFPVTGDKTYDLKVVLKRNI